MVVAVWWLITKQQIRLICLIVSRSFYFHFIFSLLTISNLNEICCFVFLRLLIYVWINFIRREKRLCSTFLILPIRVWNRHSVVEGRIFVTLTLCYQFGLFIRKKNGHQRIFTWIPKILREIRSHNRFIKLDLTS